MPGWNVIATYANTDVRVTKSNDMTVGSRLWGVPQNIGSVWSTYDFQQAVLSGFKVGAGVTVRDSAPTYDANGLGISPYSVPGYALVGLMAGYSVEIGKSKITTQLNIDNLLDKRYFTNAFVYDTNPSGYNLGYAQFGTPRTVMGSINIQY